METQQTPQVIQQPFAAQGDKNTIPNAATGTNRASLQEGFPPITGMPVNKGGIPPERLDFNGAMNLNSQFYFAFQNGWWPTFYKEVSDAIGGYPKDAVLWLFDSSKSRVRILQSLIPNNTYNFNTDASYIGKYWKELAQDGRGYSIGQIVLSQSNLATDNPGCLPAWTGEYYTNAVALYPDFYAWVKSHPELCKTKAEYDAAIATYGECPYYVADEVSGSLRLPKLANYIKMANSTEGITQKGAGLPDHDHTMHAKGTFSGLYFTNTNSAFSGGGNSAFGGDAAVHADLRTGDASQSNEVYGAADTVQPAHTTLYPWVYAYNAAVPASTAQAAEFTAALSGKANADLSNCPPNYDYVVEHYNDGAGNWYRKYKSGWLEQGGTYTTDSDKVGTITYLKPFSAVPSLLVNVSKLTDGATFSGNANWDYLVPYYQTATSFTIKFSIWGGRWEAKGQGAE